MEKEINWDGWNAIVIHRPSSLQLCEQGSSQSVAIIQWSSVVMKADPLSAMSITISASASNITQNLTTRRRVAVLTKGKFMIETRPARHWLVFMTAPPPAF